MTKKQCPLGEDCDLTTAWMAGRQHGIDWFTPIIEAKDAEIERLRGDLTKAQGALHQIAGKKDYADDPWDIARTTLAKLTGA